MASWPWQVLRASDSSCCTHVFRITAFKLNPENGNMGLVDGWARAMWVAFTTSPTPLHSVLALVRVRFCMTRATSGTVGCTCRS